MKITLQSIEKISKLSLPEFKTKFENNGLKTGKLSEDLFIELSAMWADMQRGKTPQQCFEQYADGTWIPTTNGYEKI